MACYRDSFTFFFFFLQKESKKNCTAGVPQLPEENFDACLETENMVV
jgi:hypothetical protein